MYQTDPKVQEKHFLFVNFSDIYFLIIHLLTWYLQLTIIIILSATSTSNLPHVPTICYVAIFY